MTDGYGGIPLNVQRTVIALLTADTADLRELAKIAGRDPATFYRGANLRRCDLSQANLVGIDLTGADKRYAQMPDGLSAGVSRTEILLKIVDNIALNLSPDEDFFLQTSVINDLIAKGGLSNLRHAAERFRKYVSERDQAATPDFRSIWARLIVSVLALRRPQRDLVEIAAKLLDHSIISSIGINWQVAVRLEKTVSSGKAPAYSGGHINIYYALSYCAESEGHAEVLVEFAGALSKTSRLPSLLWRKSIIEAEDLKTVISALDRMRSLSIPVSWTHWVASVVNATCLNDTIRRLRYLFPPDSVIDTKRWEMFTDIVGIHADQKSNTQSPVLEEAEGYYREVTVVMLKRVTSPDDAEIVLQFLERIRLNDLVLVSWLIGRLSESLTIEALWSWVVSRIVPLGLVDKFEDFSMVFEGAIERYIRRDRTRDALWLVMNFPSSSASEAILSNTSFFEVSEKYFSDQHASGKQPEKAAQALMHLYFVTGRKSEWYRWRKIATALGSPPPRFVEPLELLAAPLSNGRKS